MKEIHYAGWKKSYSNSADVSMLGYGCGVSQYPQFYLIYLDMYQVLPSQYIGSFDVFPGDMFIPG